MSMVVVDGDDIKDSIMESQLIVVVLDETCHDRHYHKQDIHNGLSRTDEKTEGVLSKPDVDVLLAMFDAGFLHLFFLGSQG